MPSGGEVGGALRRGRQGVLQRVYPPLELSTLAAGGLPNTIITVTIHGSRVRIHVDSLTDWFY